MQRWFGLRRCWARGASRVSRGSEPRASSCAPGPALQGLLDKFGGVSVSLAAQHPALHLDPASFQLRLQDSVKQWKSEGKIAVWLHIPIQQSRFITSAASEGFTFHHAEADSATMALWLGDGQSRLPGYATHQVGVAGAVLNEDTGKILVVQDRNKTTNAWKFPGGLSDQGEDIGATVFNASVQSVVERKNLWTQ